ncbi:hypothetical protein EDD18DRAFT_1211457 [Armillaria luteobubalina]|uniref:Secreted protein n=1 Tax=Armillaria luteobubalina TaxID=153913 RepID=A0AA39UCF0_9AGAR|nr:hypothetical protein EDD18DRAFT_1211457 [Armillaria luteobubalina]
MWSTAMVFHWCSLLQQEHSMLTGWLTVVESRKTASATNTSCKMNSTTPPNRNFRPNLNSVKTPVASSCYQ